MKFEQYLEEQINLNETPIPTDWDASKFNKRANSFKDIIAYALEKSKKIGGGSSRVAFEIEYKGRPTILKIAKNAKGIAQNVEEVGYLEDYYLKDLDIAIPMIDYDEANGDKIMWIHMEKADKIKEKDFIKASGGELADVIAKVADTLGKRNYIGDVSKIDDENEFVQNLTDYIHSSELLLDDLNRLANWGLYKGNPVIIDLGFNETTKSMYYKLR